MGLDATGMVVIFDLGGVLVGYDHGVICERLSRHSFYSPSEVYELAWSSGLLDRYDTGSITSKEFYAAVKEFLSLTMGFEEFAEAWSDIFWEKDDVSEILRQLKSLACPLYLMSNTNELHFEHLRRRVSVIALFDHLVLSYREGIAKPDPRMFQRAMQHSTLGPGQHFFIDDREDYVHAACSLGMRGMVFTSAEALRSALKELGLL